MLRRLLPGARRHHRHPAARGSARVSRAQARALAHVLEELDDAAYDAGRVPPRRRGVALGSFKIAA